MSFDAYHVDDATDAAIQKEIDAIYYIRKEARAAIGEDAK